MQTVFSLLVLLVLALTLALVVRFSINDAKRRGKPPIPVTLLIVLCFPLGLLIWLVFRPPLLAPYPATHPFDLDRVPTLPKRRPIT